MCTENYNNIPMQNNDVHIFQLKISAFSFVPDLYTESQMGTQNKSFYMAIPKYYHQLS